MTGEDESVRLDVAEGDLATVVDIIEPESFLTFDGRCDGRKSVRAEVGPWRAADSVAVRSASMR